MAGGGRGVLTGVSDDAHGRLGGGGRGLLAAGRGPGATPGGWAGQRVGLEAFSGGARGLAQEDSMDPEGFESEWDSQAVSAAKARRCYAV